MFGSVLLIKFIQFFFDSFSRDEAPRLLQISIRRIVLFGAWVNLFKTFPNFGLEHLS